MRSSVASPEQYAQWIVANPDKKGTPEFATVAAAYQQSKGAGAKSVAAKPPTPENPISAPNLVGAATEPLMAMGSGMVAAPASGLAGIAGSVLPGPEGQGAAWTQKVGKALTYEPKTTGGKNAMKAFNFAPEQLDKLATRMADRVADHGGSPAESAFIKTLIEGVPLILGGKGVRAVSEEGSLGLPATLGGKATVNPVVKRLADEGVTMTPGQRRGGVANALEEKVGSFLPPVKDARAKAVEQWNDARLNEALKDAGGAPLPKGTTGRDAIAHAKQEMEDRYDAVLGQMHLTGNALRNGSPFDAALMKARQLYQGNKAGAASPLAEADVKALHHIIERVTSQFDTKGNISGTSLKEVISLLRTESEKLQKSEDYSKRLLADTLGDLHQSLKQEARRQNPSLAKELDSIDKGYSKFKLAEKASVASASKSGKYTTGQALQAIKTRDKSKDKSSFATGKARGQKEAEEAQSVLGNTQPDSGTPFGMAILSALAGGGGWLAGHPAMAGGLAASPLLYSQPVLRALQRAGVTGGTPVAGTLAAGIPTGAAEQERMQ
jgi:hypothetical protein